MYMNLSLCYIFLFEKFNHKCAKCGGNIRNISDNTQVKDY